MPDEPELSEHKTIPLLECSATKIFYSVQSGDNLWNIAKSQNMTLDEIINLNPKFTRDGRNPNLIYPGEQVEISSSNFLKKEVNTGILVNKQVSCLEKLKEKYSYSEPSLEQRNHLYKGMRKYLNLPEDKQLEDGWYIVNNHVPEFEDLAKNAGESIKKAGESIKKAGNLLEKVGNYVNKEGDSVETLASVKDAQESSEKWAKKRGGLVLATRAHSNLVRIENGKPIHVEGFYNNPKEASFGGINSSSSEFSGMYPKTTEEIIYAEKLKNVDDDSMCQAIQSARKDRFETNAKNKGWGPWQEKGYFLGGTQCQDFVTYVEKKAKRIYQEANKKGPK